jgi:type VI secretion system lysozyme-like protein
MAMRQKQAAATRASGASLFDRLIEDEAIAHRTKLTAQDTVLRDLRRLLNTRRSSTELLDPTEATVLDYGIPNFTPMSSLQDMERCADLITNAIRIFEPRLKSPHVVLVPSEVRPDRAQGTITGMIEVNGRTERILFPLAVDPQAGEAEILSPTE